MSRCTSQAFGGRWLTRLGTTVKSESQKGLLHYATMAREASTIRIRPILYLHYAKGLVCPVSASEYGRLLQCFLFPGRNSGNRPRQKFVCLHYPIPPVLG